MMESSSGKMSTLCPDCETEIFLANTKVGQKVTCPECWAYLKIRSQEPLEVEWALEDEDIDLEFNPALDI